MEPSRHLSLHLSVPSARHPSFLDFFPPSSPSSPPVVEAERVEEKGVEEEEEEEDEEEETAATVASSLARIPVSFSILLGRDSGEEEMFDKNVCQSRVK